LFFFALSIAVRSCNYRLTNGKIFYGNDIYKNGIQNCSSASSCQDMCDECLECTHFYWDAEHSNCWIKSAKSMNKETSDSFRDVVGEKKKNCNSGSSCQLRLFESVACCGENITISECERWGLINSQKDIDDAGPPGCRNCSCVDLSNGYYSWRPRASKQKCLCNTDFTDAQNSQEVGVQRGSPKKELRWINGYLKSIEVFPRVKRRNVNQMTATEASPASATEIASTTPTRNPTTLQTSVDRTPHARMNPISDGYDEIFIGVMVLAVLTIIFGIVYFCLIIKERRDLQRWEMARRFYQMKGSELDSV